MEVIFCRIKCLIGGHVMHQCISSGWHILQEDVSYWKTYLTGGQVLFEGISYRRAFFSGRYVLQEYMFYRMAYLIG